MRARGQFLNALEVQTGRPVGPPCVRVEELLIGFNDADDLNVASMQSTARGDQGASLQKSSGVAMNKSNDGDTERRGVCRESCTCDK